MEEPTPRLSEDTVTPPASHEPPTGVTVAPAGQAWLPGGGAPLRVRDRGWVRWIWSILLLGMLLFVVAVVFQAAQRVPSGVATTSTAVPAYVAAGAPNSAATAAPTSPPNSAPNADTAPSTGAASAVATSAAPTPAAAPPTAAPAAPGAPPAAILGADAGLKEPRGVGLDAAGTIYIADSGNHRIVHLDASGKLLGAWDLVAGTPTPNATPLPGDLAMTPDGHPAVIDVTSGSLWIFTPDGKVLLTVPHVASSPSGLAVGPDGRIWIADTAGGRVVRLTPDGKPDAVLWGGNPNTPGRLNQPVDVAVAPDGTVYVIDLNKRIALLDAQGQVTKSWPVEIGVTRGGSHLAVWQNHVVFTDPDRQRLGVLDPATGAVRYVGQPGTAPGQFRLPIGLAAGPGGNLYVVDSDNARVQIFTTLDVK